MDRDADFAAYASGRWQPLLRSAVLLGCSLPEAEDLTQTTLMRCYLSWGKVTKALNRDAYVSRVMINAHRDAHRRRWRTERPVADVPEVAVNDQIAARDGVDAVHRALAGLGAKHREVVVLRFYLQLSELETAEALGVPQGTVKSRLSRALHQLSNAEDLAGYREGNRS
jgi:RNA polymerase sigma-70 factor (sigma-E family)